MTTFIVGFPYCLFFISVKILFLNRFKLIFGFIRNCSVRRRHSCRWTKTWRLSLPKSKKSRILTCGCACILIKVSKSALLVCVCVYIQISETAKHSAGNLTFGRPLSRLGKAQASLALLSLLHRLLSVHIIYIYMSVSSLHKLRRFEIFDCKFTKSL